jgi:hypothetical protein
MKMKISFIKTILLSAFLLAPSLVFADLHFTPLTLYKDKNCSHWSDRRFDAVRGWETFGVAGSDKAGFDTALPITREGVSEIFTVISKRLGSVTSENQLKSFIDNSKPFKQYDNQSPIGNTWRINFQDAEDQYTQYMVYSFSIIIRDHITKVDEGLILELITRFYLQRLTSEFPEERYAITGGVEYRTSPHERAIGELDIIVYDRNTCEVVMVGESKATVPKLYKTRLAKAKDQLGRFRKALKDY